MFFSLVAPVSPHITLVPRAFLLKSAYSITSYSKQKVFHLLKFVFSKVAKQILRTMNYVELNDENDALFKSERRL